MVSTDARDILIDRLARFILVKRSGWNMLMPIYTIAVIGIDKKKLILPFVIKHKSQLITFNVMFYDFARITSPRISNPFKAPNERIVKNFEKFDGTHAELKLIAELLGFFPSATDEPINDLDTRQTVGIALKLLLEQSNKKSMEEQADAVCEEIMDRMTRVLEGFRKDALESEIPAHEIADE